MKIAIFGENLNDTKAIRELVLGLRPELVAGDVRVLRNPPTLVRDASRTAVRSWAEKAAMALRGARAAGGAFEYVLAHTDADGTDDGVFAKERTEELRAAGLSNAVAVVPVQAIESWWLLYPDATESVVPTWSRALKRGSFNTDLVDKPKAELIRRTRAKQPRRPYEEADSVAIAAAIRTAHLSIKQAANSPSFDRFKRMIELC